jgi:serine/threonine protein kinase
MPTLMLPQKGDLLDEIYVVGDLIGDGGMGFVFEGRHVHTEARVAIKCMAPRYSVNREALARFEQEATSGSIRHANVVRVYHAAKAARIERGGQPCESGPYIVMELLEGETLAKRLDTLEGSGVRIDVEEARRITLHILAGVSAAHRAGFVHRDLKPENVFLSRIEGHEMVAKVLDFGASKRINFQKITSDGVILGTYLYLSPEVLRGQLVAAQSDIYSIGVLLYRMLSGRPPFDASSIPELSRQILQGKVIPLPEVRPDVPPELAAAVAKAMAINPGDRFDTADGFRETLAEGAPGLVQPRSTHVSSTPLPGSTLVDESRTDARSATITHGPDRGDLPHPPEKPIGAGWRGWMVVPAALFLGAIIPAIAAVEPTSDGIAALGASDHSTSSGGSNPEDSKKKEFVKSDGDGGGGGGGEERVVQDDDTPPSSSGSVSEEPIETVCIALRGTCLLGQYSIEVDGRDAVRQKSAVMRLPVGEHEVTASAKVNRSSTAFRPTLSSRVVKLVVEHGAENKLFINMCRR